MIEEVGREDRRRIENDSHRRVIDDMERSKEELERLVRISEIAIERAKAALRCGS